MTPLLAAAVAARNDAQILRLQSQENRAQLRQRLEENRAVQSRCLRTYGTMFRTRDLPVPSPWSDLPWRRAGHDLDDVMVPLGSSE